MNKVKKRYEVIIENGNEYRIKSEIQKDDLFKEQYKEALNYLMSIVDSTKDKSEKMLDEQNNNIIIFDGERGQGKSSAMRTFVNIFKDSDKKDKLKDNIEKLYNNEENGESIEKFIENHNFEILKIIDPSNFENHNSVLNTVVANMYNSIKVKWDSGLKNESVEKYRKIMKLFVKTYESLSFINDQKENEKLDYSNGIEKIARVHQSDTLAENLSSLVNSYLKIMFEGESEKACLIIQIDDLDTYIKKSYTLIDEIRKYLILPNVVIILACKVEQLTLGAEIHFQKELTSFKCDNDIQFKCRDMAIRYIDKVLPFGRRIMLPSLTSLEKSSVYLSYGNKNDKKINIFPEDQGTISQTIIAMITEKTGIRYYSNGEEEHPIVPKTLRSIIDFIVFLSKMEDCKDDIDTRGKNLREFRNYFILTNIYNSNNQIVKDIGEKISKASSAEINQQISYSIAKHINENKDFSIYENEKKMFVDRLNEMYTNKDKSKLWSLGDTITFIDTLIYLYKDEFTQELKFILTSLLTFSMHELSIVSDTENDGNEIMGKRSSLFSFYNNSLFGKKLENKKNKNKVDFMINQEKTDLKSRTNFEINYVNVINEVRENSTCKAFLGYSDKNDKLKIEEAVTLLSLIVYHNGNFSDDLIGGNNAIIGASMKANDNTSTVTEVSIEALLVNLLDIRGIQSRFSDANQGEKDKIFEKIEDIYDKTDFKKGYKNILVNYEYVDAYQKKMDETKNNKLKSDSVSDSKDYYKDFFSRTLSFMNTEKLSESTLESDSENGEKYFQKLVSEMLSICLENRLDLEKEKRHIEMLEEIVNLSKGSNAKTYAVWSRILRHNLEKITIYIKATKDEKSKFDVSGLEQTLKEIQEGHRDPKKNSNLDESGIDKCKKILFNINNKALNLIEEKNQSIRSN